MKLSDQIKSGGFADPSTMQGAAVLAVVFAFFAWLFGRALRLAVQRVLGTVENLTLGYTLLRTDDNRRVVVPNSLMASQTAINLTTNDPRVVCSVPVTIGYDADIDKARAILLDLGSKHPKATQVCGCPLTLLGASGVVLSLDMWCPDAFAAIALKCDLLEKAKKRFALEGIGLPLPRTSVVLEGQGGRR